MLIKGLAITPPTIGRIAIGHITERGGKRLPERDDHFTITTQVQGRDGWMQHPLQASLVQTAASGKLRAIPVRLLFNDPQLNLRAAYSAFDRSTGRALCTGDGSSARRQSLSGVQSLPCAGPEACEFAALQGCKLFGRLNVQIDGQDDALGSFIFRTTGYNSVRTLAARLTYFNAISAGHARYLPLTLRLRAKSTTQSRRTPVYYVDLTLREGIDLKEAVQQAQQEAIEELAVGIDIVQLEYSARQALANGSFEDVAEEEAQAIVEEFYPREPELDEQPAPSEAPSKPESQVQGRMPIRTSRLTARLGARSAANEAAAEAAPQQV